MKNIKLDVFLNKLMSLLIVIFFARQASAETVALYKFNEKSPGSEVETVLNSVDSNLYKGSASSVLGGAMPVYSSDVPGCFLYKDGAYSELLSSDSSSVAFSPASGNNKSGGVLLLADVATAISKMDKGTVEFFAKSDAVQTWRNIITFDAGAHPFKICFQDTNIAYQNFAVYGDTDYYKYGPLTAASGVWHHIAVVWNKENGMLTNYFNYASCGSVIYNPTGITVSRPMYVGSYNLQTGADCINGKVFGLRVSDKILSPQEMLRVSFFPVHNPDIVVRKDGIGKKETSLMKLKEGGVVDIRNGLDLVTEIFYKGDSFVEAGVYTGIGGAEGATEVPWIQGGGTLRVKTTPPENSTPETVAFYAFDEKAAGTKVENIINTFSPNIFKGTASTLASGKDPVYSSDTPGTFLYCNGLCTELLSSNAQSVAFAPAEGNDKSGGLLTLADLSTAIGALDEGTIEFFAKSDAQQSWRNIITFNAGNNFKICFDGAKIYFQNLVVSGDKAYYNSCTTPAASGLWQHIALVWSKKNNIATNYYNYIARNTEILENSILSESKPFYVGGSGVAKESLYGKVFGLRVSDKILSSDEMLHVSSFPFHESGIVVAANSYDDKKASFVSIEENKTMFIAPGMALESEVLSYAGEFIPPGVYTSIGGAEGATQVPWISGGGTISIEKIPTDPSVAQWISVAGGSWNNPLNWLGGFLPSQSRDAHFDLKSSSSYSALIDSDIGTIKNVNLGNLIDSGVVVDVVQGGKVAFKDGNVNVEKGGVFQVSGGEVSATNTLFNFEAGSEFRMSGGVFALTNTTKRAFTLKEGSSFNMTGGKFILSGGIELLYPYGNTKMNISGDAVMDLMSSKSTDMIFFGDVEFSGNSTLHASKVYLYPQDSSDTSITFKDNAKFILGSTHSFLNLGGGTGKRHLSVNFESSGETSSSSGIFIGSSVATTVNIRNGYRLRGEGNYNVIGTTHNAHRYATVNVYNGAFVEDTGYQYEDFLYGFSIGDGRMYNGKSEEVKGVLNIYPDGVVSNIAKVGITAAGSGVYLRLGSGKLSKGIINQYGGKLYHLSPLQCIIGVFAGDGEWNITQGGVATLTSDVYIGGAVTNVLGGFSGKAQPGHSPYNGGPKFEAAYDYEAFAPSKGMLKVANGCFSTTQNIFLSVLGEGKVSVGSSGRIECVDFVLSNSVCKVEGSDVDSSSELRIALAKDSAGCVAASGKLIVSPGSKLVLDFTDFTEGSTLSFPLIQYSTREGFFSDSDISIEGDVPSAGFIVKDVTRRGITGLWYEIRRGTCIIVK